MEDIVTKFMKALMQFEAYATQQEFYGIFGDERAERLWAEFKYKCDNNTTIFYRTLDAYERKQFSNYLQKAAGIEIG